MDILRLIILGAMSGYLAAFAAAVTRARRLSRVLFATGFALASLAFVYRWCQTGHAPMQNLFEVFLALGVLAWPGSLFWRRWLSVQESAVDPLLGFLILFPVGFLFSSEPRPLPPALQSGLFVPHVAAYLAAYVILLRAACVAGTSLVRGDESEQVTYRLVAFGFPPLTLGLVLGSLWARLAWGDYWGWDPKELWSLATWLTFAAYLHLGKFEGKGFGRLRAAVVVTGGVFILLTLLWVNLAGKLFPGLHSYSF